MAKKKITIAAGANPFDKSVSAAEQMFAPPAMDNTVLKEADITYLTVLLQGVFRL